MLEIFNKLKNYRIYIIFFILLIVFFYIYCLRNNKSEFTVITPQCVYGALKSKSNILIVNVLSEKMPVFIGGQNYDNRSITKTEFENIISDDGIPKNIDLVILMCAGWSCGAAKAYFNELSQRGIETKNIVDYAGGIHEWCLYSKLNNSEFKIFNINDTELSTIELNDLLKETAHSYKNNLLINSNNKYSNYCLLGDRLPNFF
jgi:hypothetical protein